MGKEYDVYVTPQNAPRFRERKIIFVTAMGFQGLNWVILDCFLEEVRMGMVLMALLTIGFTVIHCMDRRKAMWTWWYILGLCTTNLLIVGYFSLAVEMYWFLGLLAAEILICVGLAAALLRPKYRKQKSAGKK